MTFFFWISILLRATLLRSLSREVVISNSKTSCGPRHDCSYMQCGPPEAHEFDTPGLKDNDTLVARDLEVTNLILKKIAPNCEMGLLLKPQF